MPAMSDGITIFFKGDASGLSGGVKQAQSVLGGFSSAVGAGLLATGAIAVGVGIKATQMAADFQSGMTSLVTGAGESQKNMKLVSDGILSMAPAVGSTTKALTDGMYMIESAGFHGADGLNVLKAAAEGAKVGNAALSDVSNGVTTALSDYGLSADKAAMVTNTLVATVASGKTSMGSLASSLKNVLPVASSAGISLGDVSGAMATMTGEGVPAGQAANYLKTTILALEAPGAKGAAALQSIGLSANDVAGEMKKSLPGALQMITDHLKTKFPEGSQAYTAALKDITGGSSALSTMLDLTGSHMATFKSNVGNIADAVKNGGNSITGWSQVQGDFNFKMSQAQEVVETLGIKLGQKLLPAAGQMLDKITPLISKLGDWLVNSGALQTTMDVLGTSLSTVATWVGNVVTGGAGLIKFFKDNQVAGDALKAIIAGVGVGFLAFAIVSIPAVIAGFGAMAVSAWAAVAPILIMAAPFVAIGAIAAAAIFGIILAIQHWGEISKWLSGAWGAVSKFFQGLWGDISHIFGGIGQWFQDRFSEAAKGVQGAFGNTGKWFQDRWKDIQNAFGNTGQWFQDRFSQARNGINSALSNVGQFVKGQWDAQVKGWQIIGQWFHDRFTEAWNGITNVFSHIGQFLMGFWDREVQGWKNIGAWFQACFTDAWNAVTSVFSHIGQFLMGFWDREVQGWKNIGQWFQVCFTAAWNAVTGIFSHIGQFLMGLWNNEVQGWKNIGNWFKDRFTEAWNNITGVFGGIGNWFHDRWNDIVNDFQSVFSGISSIAGNVFNSVIGFFKNGFNNIIDLVNNVIRNIDNIKVAGFGVNIPLIPHLATGIENFVGGIALVGEKGPELVNLPKGANVLNAASTASLFNNFKYPSGMMDTAKSSLQYPKYSGSGQNVVVHVQQPAIHVHPVVQPNDIYIDRKKITDAVVEQIGTKMRAKEGVRAR